MSKYNILIVGLGAIGSLINYSLNLANITPYVVAKNKDQLELLRRGIKIIIDNKVMDLHHKLITYESLRNIPHTDIVFMCMKAYDFEEALKNLIEYIDERFSLLITCQNGIGSMEYAIRHLGKDKVAGLVINHGVRKLSSNKYLYVGGSECYIGQKGNTYSELITDIPRLLKFLNVMVVDDIEPYRWLKLLINAGINPVTAIFRATNGVILSNEYARKLAIEAVKEGIEVSLKLGIKLPKDPINEMLKVASKTRNNYSSMLQDIINGRKTEIDFINGVIVNFGKSLNVDVLVNEVLYLLIKGIEKELSRSKSVNVNN